MIRVDLVEVIHRGPVHHADPGRLVDLLNEFDITNKTPLAAADRILIEDGAASFAKKRITGAAILPPFTDNISLLRELSDPTRQLRVDIGAIATLNTRVLTYPDQDIDLTPGTGSFATEAEGALAATAVQDGGDLSSSSVALAALANFKANAIIGNDLAVPGVPQEMDELDIATASPVGADFILGWTAAGLLRKYTVTSLPAGSEANDLESDGTAGIAIGEVVVGTGGGTAAYQKISTITEEASPGSGDWLLGEESGGLVRRFDIGNLPAGSEINSLVADGVAGINDHQVPVGTGLGTVAYLSMSNSGTDVRAQAFNGSIFSHAAAADLSNGTTGTGQLVLESSPTIVTPTIASFASAAHNHEDAAGGATLGHNAATDNPTVAHGATGAVVGTTNAQTLSGKTLTTPIIASGGSITDAGGDPYLVFNEVAVPINRLTITQGATGDPVIIGANGDLAAGIRLAGAGAGTVEIIAPEIAATDWANANHSHAAANSGGTIAIADTTGVLLDERGGTGQTTYAQGDMLIASATDVVSKLSGGTTHQHMRMSATIPEWYSKEERASFSLEDPVATDIFGVFITNKAITVTEIQAICDNGTSAVVNVRQHTSIAAAGGTLVDQITPTTSIVSETTISSASVPADRVMFCELGTVTGSVDSVTVTVYYTED